MPRDAEFVIRQIRASLDANFRDRLIARGQAQSMIRRRGSLPPDSPSFSPFLDADLLHYGYALLSESLTALDLIDEQPTAGLPGQVRDAFVQSSYAIEAATRNIDFNSIDGFHRLIAGAASHLGGYAARAYSLMASNGSEPIPPMEATLADIAMRDLNSITQRTRRLRGAADLTDEALLSALARPDDETDEQSQFGPVLLLLSEHYMAAVATGLLAIEVGERDMLDGAIDDLQLGERASLDIAAPGPWWVFRLTRRLLGDLFDTSINNNIPPQPPLPGMDEDIWRYLRDTFVDNLLSRGRSEIDLWPSQLRAATRVFGDTADLVVALPTSAGKTRIAELAILQCLAQEKRAVYITPLRALSAQTENVLSRTFRPMGARVSSMYGSMGSNDVDTDALRASDIVVATPEKLDFALRADPSLLDDVGLIVLDEGHMIGASEREVRYESQIQRLLHRSDADDRRIVCLSAVFPSGDDLEDFVDWITDDEPDGLHRETWRPTLQRFGLVEWQGDHARMTITLGPDQPFIPRYFEAQQPQGRRRKTFPSDQRELVIATAWRLVGEGQTVLVFCPQRNSVEPYARAIVKLYSQGLLDSKGNPDVDLSDALTVGAEWFGADHPILQCLEIGVAVHHGALPGPFRREVEKLLQQGKIAITIASPTLAQGLNLTASAVLFHGLRRGRDIISGSDFSNVIGRAGRAFVDTEGLVLYPIFRSDRRLRREWLELSDGDGGKALNSGLIAACIALLQRVNTAHGDGSVESVITYLTGGFDWSLPIITSEPASESAGAAQSWSGNLELLDIGILSLLGDRVYGLDEDLAIQAMTDALRDSLWERQLHRRAPAIERASRQLVRSRIARIWNISSPAQRRGWYLAGLGADAGYDLSQISGQIVRALFAAESGLRSGENDSAVTHLTQAAGLVFQIGKFEPENRLDNWEEIFTQWISGHRLSDLHDDAITVAQFVESDLIYRLIWGLEAARSFESAQGNLIADELNGSAVAAIETGTLNWSASVLIRSGFDHRSAAIAAATSAGATFTSAGDMRVWIENLDRQFSESPSWPTPESRNAWQVFAANARDPRIRRWQNSTMDVGGVTWISTPPSEGTWLRVEDNGGAGIEIFSAGYDLLGSSPIELNPAREGILRAKKSSDPGLIILHYRGPGDLVL